MSPPSSSILFRTARALAAALLASSLLLLGACVSALTFDFDSPEAQELEDFTMNYYRAPDPGRAIELIPLMTKLVAAKPESTTWPMGGFYAGVAAADDYDVKVRSHS